MKIGSVAVVGAGAVGSYYGGRIQQAGNDVRFLLRGDYEEVRQKGLQVESVKGDFEISSPQVFKSPQEMGPVDLVLVAWKSTANEHAEVVISPLLHEQSKILTLQNGLGNVELLEKLFGENRILGGLCFVGINRLAAGHISHTGGGVVTVGEFAETGILAELPPLFGPLVDLRITDDLALAQWRKLVWNIPFNGLCVAEGGIDTQELLGRPGMREEVMELMKEVRAAAASLGHHIPQDFLEQQIEITLPMGPYKPSSMLDFINGHPLEVEPIWAEPVRRAEAAGVAVPRMKALFEKVAAMAQAR